MVKPSSDAAQNQSNRTELSQQLQALIVARNARAAKVKALSSQILAGERGLGILTRQLYETQIAIKRRELEIDRLKLLLQQGSGDLESCDIAIAQLRESGGRKF